MFCKYFLPICGFTFHSLTFKNQSFPNSQLLTYQEMLIFRLKLVDITELKNQDTIFIWNPNGSGVLSIIAKNNSNSKTVDVSYYARHSGKDFQCIISESSHCNIP